MVRGGALMLIRLPNQYICVVYYTNVGRPVGVIVYKNVISKIFEEDSFN